MTADLEQRRETRREPEGLIDTSRMAAGERAALEITESAREAPVTSRTFAGGLFLGDCDVGQIMPFPEQNAEDREKGAAFLRELEAFLRDQVRPDEIDETGEIPDAVISGLAGLGAFGIKIPQRYGGLGLSQTTYCRAAMLLGSYCGNLTALLSAHQSIGVPQPLLHFGTEEQRERYLPRVAKGEISAFALTEPGVGSDPARMETVAQPVADGSAFILNGRKMWCTNGTRAGVIVVMARTPPKIHQGRRKEQITAFIVETNWPGVEIVQRCRFMGLRALYNAVIDFHNVRVPRENILLAEGKGLRVALTTLNTGRLTLPAACVGLSKRCLSISTRWARTREQWGKRIGRHAAIADKLATMAADTFAMESMTFLTAAMVDKGMSDFRLESAMCKLRASEWAWQIANDTMQIRGGRGYETAASLSARGESPDPVERIVRDCRINTIFEGSSEIMRLFIAREALDPHLKIGAAALDSRLTRTSRATAAARASLFYGRWYPSLYFPDIGRAPAGFLPRLARHVRWASRMSRRLARSFFHQMLRYGPALEKRQLLLGRLVDIGTELFAMAAAICRAQTMTAAHAPEAAEAVELADYFCLTAALRIDAWFRSVRRNADSRGYQIAQRAMEHLPRCLADGIVHLDDAAN